MMDIPAMIATTAGVVMSFANAPQIYRLWKFKRANEFSPVTCGIFTIGTTIWTLYGFYRQDLSIVSSFIFGAIGWWIISTQVYLYTRHHAEETNEPSAFALCELQQDKKEPTAAQ